MMRREDCLRTYGSDYLIEKQVKEGKLFRIGKAIYAQEDDVPHVALLSYKYPNAVVTMHNAFYIYGLTDVVPDQYDLATDRDAAKIHEDYVKQYFMPRESFKAGICSITYQGYDVSIYSKEKMLVELLRYKCKLPFDYYKEVLLNYRRIMPTLDLQKIQDYALASPKSNKIMEALQLEVL